MVGLECYNPRLFPGTEKHILAKDISFTSPTKAGCCGEARWPDLDPEFLINSHLTEFLEMDEVLPRIKNLYGGSKVNDLFGIIGKMNLTLECSQSID